MKDLLNNAPADFRSLGILGHLIIINQQIHKYQLSIVDFYLENIGKKRNETVIQGILDGKIDSLSFSDALDAFHSESADVQRSLYYVLIAIAFADNSFDEKETELISTIRKQSCISDDEEKLIREQAISYALQFRVENNKLFQRPLYLNASDEHKSLISLVANLFSNNHEEVEKENDEEKKKLYTEVIRNCAAVAEEDVKAVTPAYRGIIYSSGKAIEELEKSRNQLNPENEIEIQTDSLIETLTKSLDQDILKNTIIAKESLEQKQRTISDFTISILGRTKAGKSTLHSILTNEGREAIGSGKQRTTRFNRVYQWNMLRIIDTPGIGSGEIEGCKDEEIAESVIGESDIICFVIADDSIQTDILEFIKNCIISRNKTVAILLNHKDNISNSNSEVKFKRFLRNPNQWKTDTGEASIQGHINRINTYAEKNGFANMIRIYPVFLLAAQMATEEQYKDYSRTLWESSNMEQFISQLEKWITEFGVLKRSQTILDETAHVFANSRQKITELQEPVLKRAEEIKTDSVLKISVLEKTRDKTLTEIEKILSNELDDLANNKSLEFAESVVNRKKTKNLSKQWETYIERCGFENDLKDQLSKEITKFTDNANNILSYFLEDLYLSVAENVHIRKMHVPLKIDLHKILKLGGGGIGIVGAILKLMGAQLGGIAGVLIILASALGMAAKLFDTKAKKQHREITQIHTSIKEEIEKQKPKIMKNSLQEIEKYCNSIIEEVRSVFQRSEEELVFAVESSDTIRSLYAEEEDWINKLYAWRIIQFLSEEKIPFSKGAVYHEVIDVQRPEKNTLVIQCNHKNLNSSSLKDIIADKVAFI